MEVGDDDAVVTVQCLGLGRIGDIGQGLDLSRWRSLMIFSTPSAGRKQ